MSGRCRLLRSVIAAISPALRAMVPSPAPPTGARSCRSGGSARRGNLGAAEVVVHANFVTCAALRAPRLHVGGRRQPREIEGCGVLHRAARDLARPQARSDRRRICELLAVQRQRPDTLRCWGAASDWNPQSECEQPTASLPGTVRRRSCSCSPHPNLEPLGHPFRTMLVPAMVRFAAAIQITARPRRSR